MPSWCRRTMASVTREQPIFRARAAGTGVAKKNHTWAPSPERDRSTATDRPASRQVATKAVTSSFHELSSWSMG